jgi:uncharacterized protein (TIGR02453 family)
LRISFSRTSFTFNPNGFYTSMQEILDFLSRLTANNTREWFDANKFHYQQVKATQLALVQTLLSRLQTFDDSLNGLEPKDCVFRIYRDTRFAADKIPYKTNLGMYFAKGGKKSQQGGYYLHLEPGGKSMLAGGLWMPQPEVLKKIRQEVDYNPEALMDILNSPSFKEFYSGLSEEGKLKRPPKDYPADHPAIELLKLKSFTAVHSMPDEQVLSTGFVDHAVRGFQALKPLLDYLNVVFESSSFNN